MLRSMFPMLICHLDVRFMIKTDQISNPILGFNAIKNIPQTTDDKLFTVLFQISFNRNDLYKIEAFLNLLQTADSVEATVRAKGRHTLVPAGCIVHVPCKAKRTKTWKPFKNTTKEFPTIRDRTGRRIT